MSRGGGGGAGVAGDKEKESARGEDGRGKKRTSAFPSSHRSPRAFYF